MDSSPFVKLLVHYGIPSLVDLNKPCLAASVNPDERGVTLWGNITETGQATHHSLSGSLSELPLIIKITLCLFLLAHMTDHWSQLNGLFLLLSLST